MRTSRRSRPAGPSTRDSSTSTTTSSTTSCRSGRSRARGRIAPNGRATPRYGAEISLPIHLLASSPSASRAIVRYIEAKALVGGTTTGQGIRTQVRGGARLFRGAMRNVEETNDAAAARGRHARPQPRPAGRGLRGVPGEPRQAGRGRGRVLLPPGRRHERARPPDLHRPAGSRPPAAGARRDPLACADRRRPPAPGRAPVARRLVAVQQPAALRADPRPAGADRGRRAVQPGLRLVANRQQEPARGAQGGPLRGHAAREPRSTTRRWSPPSPGSRRRSSAGGPRSDPWWRARSPICSSWRVQRATRTPGSWTRSSPTSCSS